MKKWSSPKRATVLLAILFLVCFGASRLAIRLCDRLWIPNGTTAFSEMGEVRVEKPEIATVEVKEGGMWVTPHAYGETLIYNGDETVALVRYGWDGYVYDFVSENYNAADWVRVAMLVFLVGGVILWAVELRKQVKEHFFSYATPLMAAFLLLLVMSLVAPLVYVLICGYNGVDVLLADLPLYLLVIVLPLLALFDLAMFISNLSLLRHEGKTWRNLLGSLIGFLLALATLAIVMNSNASGSENEITFHVFVINLLSGLVVWTECKLTGIILCGVAAARHQPVMDKDAILILGCKLSRKGGLTPLLRGRVDRALRFAREQEKATGTFPLLIPCGGKGPDEQRSEASAMREYLLEQGVPEEKILAEDRSQNTWENLRNAKAMLAPGGKRAFSTTNYHVFRAGVWAARNDFPAEGMGSRTKWYYWPNAFMREYVALIMANLPHELIMLLMIGIQSGLLAWMYRM